MITGMRPFLYSLIILCSAAFLSALAPTDLRAYDEDCGLAGDVYECGLTDLVRKFLTPDIRRKLFEPLRGSPARRNKEDHSIWEPDRSKHGGPQWKRWENQKDWEQGRKPTSIWPDGRLRGREGEGEN